MEEEVIIPTVENRFEKFDIADFQNNVDSISGKRTVVKDGIHIEEDHQNPGYARVIYDQKSSFYLMKLFYDNGNIEKKGVVFNNGSEFGTWYHFDENGNFLKEENTDVGYDFGWNDILDYCEKNKIVLEKGSPKSGGIKTIIYKETEEGEKVWVMSYYDYDKQQFLEVTLDGGSGKELKVREIQNVGN